MATSAVWPAPRPVLSALLALALDLGAVASDAFAVLVEGDFDTDAQEERFYSLAGLVLALATLAALICSIRSVIAAKSVSTRFLAWTAVVVSGLLFLQSAAILLALAQGSG